MHTPSKIHDGILIAAILVGVSLSLTVSAAAAASPCRAFGAKLSAANETVARTAGGTETTEYVRGGGYRVTRCAADGKPVRRMALAPIPLSSKSIYVPIAKYVAGGPVYVLSYGNPSDRFWYKRFLRERKRSRSAVLRPARSPSLASVGAESGPPAVVRTSSDRSCSDAAFEALSVGLVWSDRVYEWYADEASMPRGAASLDHLKFGHRAWENSLNSCGYGDQLNVVSPYLGQAPAPVQGFNDGLNVVDFGDLDEVGCGEPGVIACTLLWISDEGTILEVDMRFGEDWPWSHSGARHHFDIWSLSAHETGHAFGLDHVYGSGHEYLTMYPFSSTGQIRMRTLARGEILGIRELYPPG